VADKPNELVCLSFLKKRVGATPTKQFLPSMRRVERAILETIVGSRVEPFSKRESAQLRSHTLQPNTHRKHMKFVTDTKRNRTAGVTSFTQPLTTSGRYPVGQA
jgi:hypothetical protein